MSLHGSLFVNQRQLGHWEAVREDETEPGVHDYRVTLVEGTNVWEGFLSHRYDDGASILASKVLACRPEDWPVPAETRSPTHYG